jgi:pyridoxamine 5'-phosphate oxidase
MALAPWRSPLARAIHLNRSLVYSRYVQLATVRSNGRPANRTLVFRGFVDDSNQLKFVTDLRSEKIGPLAQQPWAEVCWYFPKSRDQFRFSGQLTLVDADCNDLTLAKIRTMLWHDLSDAARVQFGWPDPGKPRTSNEAFELPPPDASQPLSNFAALLLEPDQVDHLTLRGNPQDRTLYRHENAAWTTEAVNP